MPSTDNQLTFVPCRPKKNSYDTWINWVFATQKMPLFFIIRKKPLQATKDHRLHHHFPENLFSPRQCLQGRYDTHDAAATQSESYFGFFTRDRGPGGERGPRRRLQDPWASPPSGWTNRLGFPMSLASSTSTPVHRSRRLRVESNRE